MNRTTCDDCGKEYGIGDSPFCRDAHGAVLEYHPFIPRFDISLGEYTSSLAERKRFMRLKNLDYSGRKVGDPRCEF